MSLVIPFEVNERRSSASLPRYFRTASIPAVSAVVVAISRHLLVSAGVSSSLAASRPAGRPAPAAARSLYQGAALDHGAGRSPSPCGRTPAVTTPRRFHRVRAVLDRRQPDLTVLLEDVQVPRNLAAILRSCDAAGVLAAHAVWPGGRLKLSRPASGGTRKWVPVVRHRTLADALAHLREQGFRILAAHPAAGAAAFRDEDYSRPTAFLLGTEETGVTAAAAAAVDGWVAIPMAGMGTSLNVSVAAALLLFEAARQRQVAGLYARSRLDADTYARTLFEWTYPRLAAHCRRKKAPYPALGEDGEIVGALPRG